MSKSDAQFEEASTIFNGLNLVKPFFSADWRKRGSAHVPVGFHLIVGESGSGKSTILRDIAAEGKGKLFICLEPDREASLNYDDAAASLREGESDLVIIDSVKELFRSLGGSTMRGGVSARFLTFCTAMSVFAMRAGVCVVATLNPAMTASVSEAELFDMVNGATTSTAMLNYGATANIVFSYRHGSDRKMREIEASDLVNFYTRGMIPHAPAYEVADNSGLITLGEMLNMNMNRNRK